MEEEATRVIVRRFDPQTDKPFIFSSWRNAVWFGEKRGPEREAITNQFYKQMTREIARVIKNPATQVRVACMSHQSDQIAGYAVMEGRHLHWVYVKSDYRGSGIARILTQGFDTISQPMTEASRAIAEKKNLKIKEI